MAQFVLTNMGCTGTLFVRQLESLCTQTVLRDGRRAAQISPLF
jgi:hypothetical protein